MAQTKTDPAATRMLDDEPMQLRAWGTARVLPLPPADGSQDWPIGAAKDSWMPMQDAEGFVSRHHAVLRLTDSRWSIVDMQSKNGLWIDGRRTERAWLDPGIEIGIGRLRFVVETPRLVRRRDLLARWLGWANERQAVVDRALRAIRAHEARRTPLWLTGDDDLVAIARRLHRELLGDRPFIVRTLRELTKAWDEATRAAATGTLCVEIPQVRAPALRELLGERELACGIVIGTRMTDQVGAIHIPPLSSRRAEMDRVVDAYAQEALVALGASRSSYRPRDRAWLLSQRLNHGELESATRRLIAIAELGVTHAAPLLGVTHSALSRWASRRTRRRAGRVRT